MTVKMQFCDNIEHADGSGVFWISAPSEEMARKYAAEHGWPNDNVNHLPSSYAPNLATGFDVIIDRNGKIVRA